MGAGRFLAPLCVVAMSLPAAGRAAPISANPRAKAEVLIVKPLTLQTIADLDFANLGVTTGGTATIDPVTGSISLAGGIVRLGGTPSPARFAGAATRQSVVNIKIPKQPVLIRRVGGTETLSVSNFTLDGQDKRNLAQQSSFVFAVGAQITVPANAIEGVYVGDIDVTVNYP